MQRHRIVSLIPSGTEIVAALGYESQIVGRSHECDFPPDVVGAAVCTESKVDSTRTSRQIEDEVREKLVEAVSLYRVHADELKRLEPTLIVTQAQCEVCAVSLRDVEEAVCGLFETRPGIVSLEPMQLDDIWKDILRVGKALECELHAAQVVENLQQRLEAIRLRTVLIGNRPRVACIEWIDPLMAAGNWVPELVDIAGGENLFGRIGEHSPWLEWESLKDSDPDVIIAMPCGFDIERTAREMSPLVTRPGWKELRAVRELRVYLVDGNQYFNRPGPRLVESAEILAEILHPQKFDFGHRGAGWIPLP
ncbi:MAG: cobalamin-binding protein [Planctomycetaceae bacterium]